MQLLVTDDDLPTRKMLRFVLEHQAGHTVSEAASGEQALACLTERRFDLLVTDLVLPGTSGLDLVREVRKRSTLPILVVSGRAEISDRVRGLRYGADDYLTKPFDPSELIARVEALLRRCRQAVHLDRTGLVRAGSLTIDLLGSAAMVDGQKTVRLTPTELRVLLRLAQPPGEARTREELALAVWGPAGAASANAINTYVADLRRKLEPRPERPSLVLTVRGVGYQLSASL